MVSDAKTRGQREPPALLNMETQPEAQRSTGGKYVKGEMCSPQRCLMFDLMPRVCGLTWSNISEVFHYVYVSCSWIGVKVSMN